MNLSKYGVPKNNKVLDMALTHASYANENGGECYERLEFLGDAVIELIISDYLYKHTKKNEGEMSKFRSTYVCESALYAYAESIGLIKHIKVGEGLKGHVTETIVADVFESVVGAIYINSGYNRAKKFVLDITMPYIKKGVVFSNDYKSYLQELVQTEKNSVTYKLIKASGPSHNKKFEVEVLVGGIVYGKGTGKTKKEAEQKAAFNAISKKAGE